MIKLVDQLSAMGSFPIATAQDIVCSDNERLQEKIDNGTLGGGGGSTATTLTQEEYDALDPQEQLEGEFYCYDSARHFRNGVEYGKAVDISGKQDNLNQVKFTIRRNSVNEPRYCMIASSDLSQNLLMCEPYRFKGIFGSSTESVEKKSLIDLYVSFREGAVADKVMKGYADSSEAFDYVDLIITVDEETNRSYAYVDFLTSGSMCSGEITVPVLDAEKYMTFAESFELVDSMIGTELCRMSDYCKVITEIDDTNDPSNSTVWSSKKTSDELKGRLLTTQIAPNSLGFDVGSTVTLEEFLRTIYNKYGMSGTLGFWWSGSNEIYVEHNGTKVKINGGIFTWQSTNINTGWQHMTAIYAPNSSANTMYKMFLNTGEEAGTITSQGIEVIPTLSDTSSTTSTYSSSKIDEKIDGTAIQTTTTTDYEYYAITYGDSISTAYNQGILIQYNRLNFPPSTYIFSTTSYVTDARETVSVAKISNNFAGKSYDLKFYIDKDNKTMYLKMPSYSRVSLQDLAFKSKAVTYTKVDSIPDTATALAVAEYASINDSSIGDTVSTWSSNKIASRLDLVQEVFMDLNYYDETWLAGVPVRSVFCANANKNIPPITDYESYTMGTLTVYLTSRGYIQEYKTYVYENTWKIVTYTRAKIDTTITAWTIA